MDREVFDLTDEKDGKQETDEYVAGDVRKSGADECCCGLDSSTGVKDLFGLLPELKF